MIHTGLTILRAVDSITFTKLNFSEFVELVDLPTDKSIIVGIGVRGKERTAPVYTRTERIIISLEALLGEYIMIQRKKCRTIAMGGK